MIFPDVIASTAHRLSVVPSRGSQKSCPLLFCRVETPSNFLVSGFAWLPNACRCRYAAIFYSFLFESLWQSSPGTRALAAAVRQYPGAGQGVFLSPTVVQHACTATGFRPADAQWLPDTTAGLHHGRPAIPGLHPGSMEPVRRLG